jgi:hypothetical protein
MAKMPINALMRMMRSRFMEAIHVCLFTLPHLPFPYKEKERDFFYRPNET